MKIYVIDTARDSVWQEYFPDAIYVCSDPVAADREIFADDVVFAHTHEVNDRDNPDLVLILDQCSPNVAEFCKKIQEASNIGIPPRMILYSGESVPNARANYWTRMATATCGPFFGVKSDRIKILSDAIPRHVTADRLKDVVNEVLHRLKTSDAITPSIPNPTLALEDVSADAPIATDKKSSFSVMDRLDRNAEAVFAARLIIDADEHCAGNPSNDCHDVTIYRPDLDLVRSANTVIHARQSLESLNAAVDEFLCKLG